MNKIKIIPKYFLFMSKYLKFTFIWIILFLSFYNNFFHTMDSQYHFDVFMDGTQSLVWARIARADQHGVFSDGMLMGRCYPVPDECEGNNSLCAKRYQTKIYLNKHKIERYDIYKSHPAFQALIFTSIDAIFNFEPSLNIKIFKFLTALFNSLIITLLIIMLFNRYGNFVIIFITVISLFNFWLVCFGNELYMFIGFLLIPLLVSWKLYEYESLGNSISNLKKFIIIMFAVLIKCLFTGFEFITCSVLMIFIPLFFFAIENKWNFKRLLLNNIIVTIGITTAALITFLILCIQKWTVEGDFYTGFDHIIGQFVLRTVGINDLPPEKLNLISVFSIYLNELAIRQGSVILVSFKDIVIYHIFGSILLLILKKYKSLVIVSWISMIVSTSWLVIFREHSVIHAHVDPIIWYMPYIFFALAVIGISIKEVVLYIISKLPAKSKATIVF